MSSSNESLSLKTVRDFIRYATTAFNRANLYFGHGTDNAWDEATALVFHVLHLPHDTHPTVLDARLLPSERQAILELIHQRVENRTPLAYLTQTAWFAGLSFFVDERVLIPRSPIAELIQKQFSPWLNLHTTEELAILDLCTGSGCIAIACAYAFPDATVDACDISKEALAVATINRARHHLENQVHLFESDLFNQLPQKKYDLIVSNPPYVSQEEMTSLPKEYQQEPHLALAAGTAGLDIVERILQDAKQYLKPNGILVVEVGNSEEALVERHPALPFVWLEFEHGDGGVFMLNREDC